MSQTTDWSPDRDEEDRIRAVYARRDAGGAKRSARADAGERYIVETRARRVVELLARHGITRLGTQRILDVGCGTGFWLTELVRWGADPSRLTGIDLVPDRAEIAPFQIGGDQGHPTAVGATDLGWTLDLDDLSHR